MGASPADVLLLTARRVDTDAGNYDDDDFVLLRCAVTCIRNSIRMRLEDANIQMHKHTQTTCGKTACARLCVICAV